MLEGQMINAMSIHNKAQPVSKMEALHLIVRFLLLRNSLRFHKGLAGYTMKWVTKLQ